MKELIAISCQIFGVYTGLKFADMVILGRRRYGANQLVSIIKSAAKLDFMDEQMLDRYRIVSFGSLYTGNYRQLK